MARCGLREFLALCAWQLVPLPHVALWALVPQAPLTHPQLFRECPSSQEKKVPPNSADVCRLARLRELDRRWQTSLLRKAHPDTISPLQVRHRAQRPSPSNPRSIIEQEQSAPTYT